MTSYSIIKTPLGDLMLVANTSELIGLYFADSDHVPATRNRWTLNAQHPVLQQTEEQLREYFAGKREKVSRSRCTWMAPISRKRSGGKSRASPTEKRSAIATWPNGRARPMQFAPLERPRDEIPLGSSFPAIEWWGKMEACVVSPAAWKENSSSLNSKIRPTG